MVTQNPVKLVMKWTLILKTSPAIKIHLCTAVGQADWIPSGGKLRGLCGLCQSMNLLCVSDSLSTSGQRTWIPKQILQASTEISDKNCPSVFLTSFRSH